MISRRTFLKLLGVAVPALYSLPETARAEAALEEEERKITYGQPSLGLGTRLRIDGRPVDVLSLSVDSELEWIDCMREGGRRYSIPGLLRNELRFEAIWTPALEFVRMGQERNEFEINFGERCGELRASGIISQYAIEGGDVGGITKCSFVAALFDVQWVKGLSLQAIQ